MQGTLTSNGELLSGTFLTDLTLTQSINNGTKTSFINYASANAKMRQEMMMSPIPEMNSSKGSITQASNTKTLDDDRKLTGTG